jgi:hypothetical protein
MPRVADLVGLSFGCQLCMARVRLNLLRLLRAVLGTSRKVSAQQ